VDKLGAARRTAFPRNLAASASARAAPNRLVPGVSNYHAVNVLLKKPFGFGLSADVRLHMVASER